MSTMMMISSKSGSGIKFIMPSAVEVDHIVAPSNAGSRMALSAVSMPSAIIRTREPSTTRNLMTPMLDASVIFLEPRCS